MTDDFGQFMGSIGAVDPDPPKRERVSCSMGANGCLGVSIEHHVAHVNYLTEENDQLRRMLRQEARRRGTAWLITAFAVCAAFWALVWGWAK